MCIQPPNFYSLLVCVDLQSFHWYCVLCIQYRYHYPDGDLEVS